MKITTQDFIWSCLDYNSLLISGILVMCIVRMVNVVAILTI